MKLEIPQADLKELQKIQAAFARQKSDEDIFYHLCFCLMAPQTTFVNNKRAINELIRRDFYRKNLHIATIENIIRCTRFYKNKAKYLMAAKQQFADLLPRIREGVAQHDIGSQNLFYNDSLGSLRDYLVKHVKGFGYKAASHFLRNLGVPDFAVIDIHVLRFMSVNKAPHTAKQYKQIEKRFCKIAEDNNILPAALDAYVWKMYSGTDYRDHDY